MGIFNKKNEEVLMLLKTQENIEMTQKNITLLLDKISDVIDKKDKEIEILSKVRIEKEDLITEEEKLRAAYALNLCTVSISQIIDYNDINILEQEYDIILNNLNLEHMPKDEALLNTLKLLLDTITFFRIQEGDKRFVEREYQEKLKNAIWSAVPNFGLIVAGGNPWSMAISLASQVGCGYMNYRKTKAQSQLEKEKSEWELQRSAIEQFNGIRRELFDTAWRLADKYKFPDRYRLTERRIKQYNSILMDPENYRRYDRLMAIKDNFDAYPPFWYYLGNTANSISQEEPEEGAKLYYKQDAQKHFEAYIQKNENVLLREDHVLASCCLEYIELLDCYDDKEKIINLLDKAVQASGDVNDIIQLCALNYLKVGSVNNASDLLKRLVNEDYNATLNAQILSKIYVYEYINNNSASARYDYNILGKRVDSKYLFPMPTNNIESSEKLYNKFLESQRIVLSKKYMLVLEAFFEKYEIKFNKVFPVPSINNSYGDNYFKNQDNSNYKRIEDIKRVLQNNRKAEEYKQRLRDRNISFAIIDTLNEIYNAISCLNCLETEKDLGVLIKMNIDSNKDNLNELQRKIDENIFGENEIKLMESLNLNSFTDMYFEEIIDCINSYITNKNTMEEFTFAEQNLREFCIKEGLQEPEVLFKNSEKYKYIEEVSSDYFTPALLGEEAIQSNNEAQLSYEMIKIINNIKDELITNTEKASIYIKTDRNYDIYMNNKNSKIDRYLRKRTLAIIEDTTFNTKDIIFTTTGIILLGKTSLKAEVSYGEITYIDTKDLTLKIGDKYKNKNINLEKLYDLAQELAGYVKHK